MLIAFPSLIFAILTLLMYYSYKSRTDNRLDELKMELLGESENKTSFEAKYNQAMSELKRYEELKKGKELDEIQLLFAKVNMLDDKITFLNSSSKNKLDTIISMIESLKALNEDNKSLIQNIIIDNNENENDLEDINNSFNHIKEQKLNSNTNLINTFLDDNEDKKEAQEISTNINNSNDNNNSENQNSAISHDKINDEHIKHIFDSKQKFDESEKNIFDNYENMHDKNNDTFSGDEENVDFNSDNNFLLDDSVAATTNNYSDNLNKNEDSPLEVDDNINLYSLTNDNDSMANKKNVDEDKIADLSLDVSTIKNDMDDLNKVKANNLNNINNNIYTDNKTMSLDNSANTKDEQLADTNDNKELEDNNTLDTLEIVDDEKALNELQENDQNMADAITNINNSNIINDNSNGDNNKDIDEEYDDDDDEIEESLNIVEENNDDNFSSTKNFGNNKNIQDDTIKQHNDEQPMDSDLSIFDKSGNEDIKTEEYNNNDIIGPTSYDDFSPTPSYVDQENNMSSRGALNNNETNINKVQPKTALSNNTKNSANTENNNMNFDIKESIEKLKAQLNETNES